jgi:hypothetical protein
MTPCIMTCSITALHIMTFSITTLTLFCLFLFQSTVTLPSSRSTPATRWPAWRTTPTCPGTAPSRGPRQSPDREGQLLVGNSLFQMSNRIKTFLTSFFYIFYYFDFYLWNGRLWLLMGCLHWQSLLAKLSATGIRDSRYCTCLGHLGRHDKK